MSSGVRLARFADHSVTRRARARRWAERRYRNLHRWTERDRGGHFPGLEQPDLLVSEIRAAFRDLPVNG
ncbi:hypothetical protein [Amycolatopsis sp. cmx-4-54]|uniref:hypothetical protein n=1 Tax=Amycolatopsis sp. cmx-4-54 TaxID=2790936 RepID=UPI00397B324D